MKKIILVLAVAATGIPATQASAQVRVNVNINIGNQPDWGPSGYDYVDYYYLPDIETYYYVSTRQYIWLNGGSWMFTYYLPSRYRGYNVYSGYKVVINSPRPYLQHTVYRDRYSGFRGYYGRQGINKNYNRYKEYHGRNKDHGNKHGRGNGRGRGRH